MSHKLPVGSKVSQKQVGWTAISCVALAILSLAYIMPTQVNSAIKAVNQKTNIGLPELPARGFNLGLDLQGGVHLVYRADTEKIPVADRLNAVEGVRDVIERRVRGGLGVAEPIVQTTQVGEERRLIVELPGVKDTKEAIRMIGETPVLEFKIQNNAPERSLTSAEEKQLLALNVAAEKKIRTALSELNRGKNFVDVANQYSEDEVSKKDGGNIGFITLASEPEMYQWAEKHKDNEWSKEPIKAADGYNIVKRISSRPGQFSASSTDYQVARIFTKISNRNDIVPPADQWKSTGLSGKQLKRAEVVEDSRSGQAEVSLSFDDEGTKLFAQITAANVGKPIAIFLDGEPISVPRVNEPITEGKAIISGNFSFTEARDLSQRLNSGALPVPIELISQEAVGASLGADSLAKSFAAGYYGIALVMLFMVFYYRFPGFVSVIALAMYAIFTLAIFKLIGATLTLAGIAGFIMSVGMAVDANVLVFERLKEELRAGKSLTFALEEAFIRAWSSVRDSNITTLISCVFLIWFGVGFVQGFAITLALGVLVSIFTAIVVTRSFMRLTSARFPEAGNILFLGHRKE